MFFKSVYGHEKNKQRLISSVNEGRVPHAQLLSGDPGIGKMALGMAFARYLYCTGNKAERGDACGECPACKKMNVIGHPDLHFLLPNSASSATLKEGEKNTIAKWKEFLTETHYRPDLLGWYQKLGIENKQPIISARDCEGMIRKLSLKAYEGNYKVVIIWMLEKLFHAAAPKILKILEEPPEKTVFILISEKTDQILPTILSRAQHIRIPSMDENSMVKTIEANFDFDQRKIREAVALSENSYHKAVQLLQSSEQLSFNFDNFTLWMRMSYAYKVKEILDFTSEFAGMGREVQKSFLQYGLNIMRKSILMSTESAHIARNSEEEQTFLGKFAPFVHTNNIAAIDKLLNDAIMHIERNANPSLVLFDVSVKMHYLLRSRF